MFSTACLKLFQQDQHALKILCDRNLVQINKVTVCQFWYIHIEWNPLDDRNSSEGNEPVTLLHQTRARDRCVVFGDQNTSRLRLVFIACGRVINLMIKFT